jgi:hypothetical protein
MSSDRKKTVDEIWRELNTRSGARQVPRSATTGVRGFGLPGVTTHTRVLPRSDAALTSGAPVANPGTRKVGLAGAGADSGGDPPGSAGAAAATYDSAAAAVGVATEELTSAVASMQRHLNCLSDADRATRRGGLDSLRARLSRGSDGAPPPAPPLLQALLVGPLMRPLCGLLADPVEGLRLGVLTLLRDAVRQLPAPGALLPGLLPPLVARMGTTPVQEPAEEVRLAALQLLEELVRGAEPRCAELAPCSFALHTACSDTLLLLLLEMLLLEMMLLETRDTATRDTATAAPDHHSPPPPTHTHSLTHLPPSACWPLPRMMLRHCLCAAWRMASLTPSGRLLHV